MKLLTLRPALTTVLKAAISAAGAALLCGPFTAHAQPLQAWLPSSDEVAAVLRASPRIQSALARQEAQRQRARGVEVGSSEWAVRLNQQQRRARDPMERFPETTVALERTVRLWGKAGLDAQLADQDRTVAQAGVADALHEARRQLLGLWFTALRARLDLDSTEQERRLAQELDRQARVRLGQGDVSALDARLAEAELQRSEAAVRLAQAEWLRATAQLQGLYPGLPKPTWPKENASLPAPLTQPMGAALQDFLARHPELKLLRAEAQRQRQLAERVERDRWPDPSVGVYVARERAGAEQLVGLTLTMPLSGSYRESQARAALADAQNLSERVQQAEREMSAQFEGRWLQLMQQEQAVTTLQAAATTQRLAAEKSLTAHTLGEHSMTELIQNRRLANEQLLASRRMLLETLLHRAHIELDAHRLWKFED